MKIDSKEECIKIVRDMARLPVSKRISYTQIEYLKHAIITLGEEFGEKLPLYVRSKFTLIMKLSDIALVLDIKNFNEDKDVTELREILEESTIYIDNSNPPYTAISTYHRTD